MAPPSHRYIVDPNPSSFASSFEAGNPAKDLTIGHPDPTLPDFKSSSSLILLAKAIDISYAEEPASVFPLSNCGH